MRPNEAHSVAPQSEGSKGLVPNQATEGLLPRQIHAHRAPSACACVTSSSAAVGCSANGGVEIGLGRIHLTAMPTRRHDFGGSIDRRMEANHRSRLPSTTSFIRIPGIAA